VADFLGMWPICDLWEAAELLQTDQVSTLEIVDAHLARIDQLDTVLRACITVLADDARAVAAQADRHRMGPRTDTSLLLGLPLAVKDNFEMSKVRTTAGSRRLGHYVSETDATAVARLRAAGAAIVAKVNLDELSFGGQSASPIGGKTLNPWDAASVPGGSSGGSAVAVAAGMCMAATGTDSGGSIRNPSAWCGVAGMKPTFGAVDPAGVVPLAWSMDTIGYLAHTARDCAILFAETSDASAATAPAVRHAFVKSVGTGPTRRPRLGVAANLLDASEEAARRPLRAAVDQLADVATVEELELPRLDDAMLATLVILLAEGAAVWESGVRSAWDAYGPSVRAILDLGRLVRAVEYLQAQRVREGIRRMVNGLFEHFSALVMPSMGIDPRPGALEDGLVGPDSIRWRLEAKFTCIWNLTGCPVLSLPCGFTDAGRPVAMQLVTAPGRDEEVLRLGVLAETLWAVPRQDLVPTWVRSRLAGPRRPGG
jgi:aspartyl-tRNA(Asn)/glutamyl-tRNA(Gln) amidotransferase subunit A